MTRSPVETILCIFVLTLTFGANANAQLKSIFDSTKRAAEKELEKTIEDAVGDAVSCAVDDTKCVEKAKKDGADVVIVDNDGNVLADADGKPITDPQEAQASVEQPGEGIWRNYDFTPGKRVKFASNWASARVGRIPKDIKYIKGNMEVVEKSGKRVLEFRSTSVFQLVMDEPLPESFSLEFRAQTAGTNQSIRVHGEAFSGTSTSLSRYERHYLNVWSRAGIDFKGSSVSGATSLRLSDSLHDVKFQIDDGYAIMYVGTNRVAQIPNAKFPSSNIIEFYVSANDRLPAYLSDIVVAYDVDDPYGSLMANSQYTTRGILFDFNADRLRPESTPVLEQLRDMLETHSDLQKVIIEGHTDSAGEADYNLDLSSRRAASVKAYLVGKGIEPNRIDSSGRGEQDPVADNSTEAGRQENRRVVIRLPDKN